MTCPHPEKYKHVSAAAALAARDSLERERGIDLGLRPYRCVCGSWHLGHRGKDPSWAKKLRRKRR